MDDIFDRSQFFAEAFYWIAALAGAAWVAWVVFAHLPFEIALFAFPLAFALFAAVAGPLAAGLALVFWGAAALTLCVMGRARRFRA
ncbi:MAG: hypothetical protein LBS70_09800 [Candidatus Accumulibacter sp.]|nr:hypothetical protein [Accumulibacter sp.]